ncbi:MAG: efflux RND transporter permease subunit [Pseudodesulfovibrio sp.]|nr:efflux RND transporter permease subunit [Pseudodesulfovibrio sp.]
MNSPKNGGLIAWFVENPIAANLLMFLILTSGIMVGMNRPMQAFPHFPPKNITIEVKYPSSSAEVVEQGVTIKIEEALTGVTGVKKITSTSTRVSSTVTVEKAQEGIFSR